MSERPLETFSLSDFKTPIFRDSKFDTSTLKTPIGDTVTQIQALSLHAILVSYDRDPLPQVSIVNILLHGELCQTTGTSTPKEETVGFFYGCAYTDTRLSADGQRGRKKRGHGGTTQSRPLDAPHLLEAGWPEGEGAAIEEHDIARVVALPQSTAIGTLFAPQQQLAVLIYIAEAQCSLLGDDKLLVHIFMRIISMPYHLYRL